MVYNEPKNILENIELNKLNNVLEETDSFQYKVVNNKYEALSLIQYEYGTNWFSGGAWYNSREPIKLGERNIGTIFCAKGMDPCIIISGEPINMSPIIVQKCKQLLYKYKLQSSNVAANAANYDEIIAAEQSRDIYTLCRRPEKFGLLKNVQNYILVDEKDEIEKHPGFIPRLVYNTPKFKRFISRMLFAKRKGDFIVEDDFKDGMYNIYIRDRKNRELLNKFSFQSKISACRFESNFYDMPAYLYEQIISGQIIKAKIR